MNEVTSEVKTTTEGMAKVVYILYLVGLLTGVTALIGVVMAYVNESEAPEWLRTHYRFQIRTFWIGFLYLFVGTILSLLVIGFFILLFWAVWVIVRCIKGFKYLDQKAAYPNPTSWLF
jgi:uncharacterized membrane protein